MVAIVPAGGGGRAHDPEQADQEAKVIVKGRGTSAGK